MLNLQLTTYNPKYSHRIITFGRASITGKNTKNNDQVEKAASFGKQSEKRNSQVYQDHSHHHISAVDTGLLDIPGHVALAGVSLQKLFAL